MERMVSTRTSPRFRPLIAYGTYDYHLKPMYWNTTAPRDSFYYVNQWGPEYEASKAIEYINEQKDQNNRLHWWYR